VGLVYTDGKSDPPPPSVSDPLGGWPMLSQHTKAGALPFSRSLREGGAFRAFPWLAHLYVLEAVTKLKIVRFESQDVVPLFRPDHNL